VRQLDLVISGQGFGNFCHPATLDSGASRFIALIRRTPRESSRQTPCRRRYADRTGHDKGPIKRQYTFRLIREVPVSQTVRDLVLLNAMMPLDSLVHGLSQIDRLNDNLVSPVV